MPTTMNNTYMLSCKKYTALGLYSGYLTSYNEDSLITPQIPVISILISFTTQADDSKRTEKQQLLDRCKALNVPELQQVPTRCVGASACINVTKIG